MYNPAQAQRAIWDSLTADEQLRLAGDEDGYPMHSGRAVVLGLIVFDRGSMTRMGRWVYTSLGRAVRHAGIGLDTPEHTRAGVEVDHG